MGEGATLALLNGTPYVWKKKDQGEFQMKAWSFPDEVKPGVVSQNYVEFDQAWHTKTRKTTQGHCTYTLDGTTCSFIIQATDEPSNIRVQLHNMTTAKNPKDSWIRLGWAHDGVVCFILSGKEGSFSSSNPPTNWMQQNLNTLGSRPLHMICMPGTHDAGMGEITWAEHIPDWIISYFTQTQSRRIYGQLQLGSRYFDIRPEVSGGDIYTGHYSGKLGARGQKMSSIIDDLNEFTAKNAELVIVNLSHAKQTDDNFRDYNQSDWDALFKELLRVNNRFIISAPAADDLSLLPLSKFIGSGRAAVIFVVEAPDNISLGSYANQGFYRPEQLNVYNEYSNSNDCVNMVRDQLEKMIDHMPSGDKRMFLISWTLTEQPPPGFEPSPEGFVKLAAWAEGFKSIKEMAYSANKALVTTLLPYTSRDAFPNIIYIDFMENTNYAALAMAVNNHAFA